MAERTSFWRWKTDKGGGRQSLLTKQTISSNGTADKPARKSISDREKQACSETMLTGASQFQKYGCIPGTWTAAPQADLWDCVLVWECRSSTGLWPAMIMELGQEGWLKQPAAKVRGPIMAGDQGSCWGHWCSETMLTGELQFQKCGCIPGTQTVAPLGGTQTVDSLDQSDCVLVWECRSSTNSQKKNNQKLGKQACKENKQIVVEKSLWGNQNPSEQGVARQWDIQPTKTVNKREVSALSSTRQVRNRSSCQ